VDHKLVASDSHKLAIADNHKLAASDNIDEGSRATHTGAEPHGMTRVALSHVHSVNSCWWTINLPLKAALMEFVGQIPLANSVCLAGVNKCWKVWVVNITTTHGTTMALP